MSGYTERVERGAALLDARRPGWVELIDLGELNMGDADHCVLGQIYRDDPDIAEPHDFPYFDGAADLFPDDWADIEAIKHGFMYQDYDYDTLTAEWRRLIESRRAAS